MLKPIKQRGLMNHGILLAELQEQNRELQKKGLELAVSDENETVITFKERKGSCILVEQQSGLRCTTKVITAERVMFPQTTTSIFRLTFHVFISNCSNYLFNYIQPVTCCILL